MIKSRKGLKTGAGVRARLWLCVGVAAVAAVAATGASGVSGNDRITTIAGTGAYGFSGDRGPATSAQLASPAAVAVDAKGNVFIADRGNFRVRKVSPRGRITTIAGTGHEGFEGDGGSARSAQLSGPWGVAVDGKGNVYIADTGNSRVRKVSPGGRITTIAGTGTPGFSGDGGPATSAQLIFPTGVAVDRQGNVYIADHVRSRVRKVSRGGTITTFAGTGARGFSGDGGPATAANLARPESVAVDGKGNVYIADAYNHRVRKVSPGGKITTIAGTGKAGFSGDGGPATKARLGRVFGVAVDSEGKNVYVADPDNQRVRMVSDGTITTIAGTGKPGFSGDGGRAAAAQLAGPGALAVDSKGNLYIVDVSNNRVRRVSTGSATLGTGATPAPGAYRHDYFKTLSRNIQCDFGYGGTTRAYVRCGVKSGLKPASRKGSGCYPNVWVVLNTTGIAFAAGSFCPGEDAPDSGPFAPEGVGRVLSYGQTWSGGGLRCTSTVTGLTCRNKSGHGFFLSRERWRAF